MVARSISVEKPSTLEMNKAVQQRPLQIEH